MSSHPVNCFYREENDPTWLHAPFKDLQSGKVTLELPLFQTKQLQLPQLLLTQCKGAKAEGAGAVNSPDSDPSPPSFPFSESFNFKLLKLKPPSTSPPKKKTNNQNQTGLATTQLEAHIPFVCYTFLFK